MKMHPVNTKSGADDLPPMGPQSTTNKTGWSVHKTVCNSPTMNHWQSAYQSACKLPQKVLQRRRNRAPGSVSTKVSAKLLLENPAQVAAKLPKGSGMCLENMPAKCLKKSPKRLCARYRAHETANEAWARGPRLTAR